EPRIEVERQDAGLDRDHDAHQRRDLEAFRGNDALFGQEEHDALTQTSQLGVGVDGEERERLQRLAPQGLGNRRAREYAFLPPAAQGFEHGSTPRVSAHVAGRALGVAVVQVVDDARLARKQSVGLRFGQGLDITELARDRRALAPGLVERLADLVEAILRFREELAEPAEFGLDGSEYAPYLARTLFDRQCPEPHLQTIEHRPERGRTGDVD